MRRRFIAWARALPHTQKMRVVRALRTAVKVLDVASELAVAFAVALAITFASACGGDVTSAHDDSAGAGGESCHPEKRSREDTTPSEHCEVRR